MLSHVWAWLRQTLGSKGGRCNSSHFSSFLFSALLGPLIKRVKAILSSLLCVKAVVESLNAETINTLVILSRRGLCSKLVILADLRELRC